MKILALVIFLLVCSSGSAWALTATWGKNTETDMKDYGVYMCFTKGCTVAKTTAMLQGFVLQSGTTSFAIPPNTEGGVAISARDTSNNESGVTVTVPFDQVAPSVPAPPTVQ